MREHHRHIIDWLTAQGATDVHLDPHHKHMHVRFRWQGRPLRYVTAATLSDSRRGTVNALTDLRHMLGLIEPVRRVGVRRQARRRERARPISTVPALTAGQDWRAALPDLWPKRGRRFLRKLVEGFTRFDALPTPTPDQVGDA